MFYDDDDYGDWLYEQDRDRKLDREYEEREAKNAQTRPISARLD